MSNTEVFESTIFAPIASDLNKVVESIVQLPQSEIPYHNDIVKKLAHVLTTSGKKLRPAITLLSCQLWGKKPDNSCISMATATELLHLATLVHDDTIDNADIRRGVQTASKVWGKDVAVLLGDYIFAKSAMFVCDTNNLYIVREFAKTICQLSRGELYEIDRAWKLERSREDYFRLIKDKTASLFATAAESGAILGGCSQEEATRLHQYGLNLGIAYQILDDISDYSLPVNLLGKPNVRDLEVGLITLPAIIAMETSSYAHNVISNFLLAAEKQRSALLGKALEQVKTTGALDESRKVADTFLQQALTALVDLPKSKFLSGLYGIVEFCKVSTRRNENLL